MVRSCKTTLTLILLLCLLIPCFTSYAITSEELYKEFDIPYKIPYKEEDLLTIQRYDYAERYASMFRYVSSTDTDWSVIEKKIKNAEEELQTITESLLNGFYLELSEIYELEDRYLSLQEELNNWYSTLKSIEIKYNRIMPEDIPSYEEYIRAKTRYSIAMSRSELGDSTLKLFGGISAVKDFTNTSITYVTSVTLPVNSIFNGKVINVEDDIVTINNYSGIYTSYKGLAPSVNVGDTVSRNQTIGYSSGVVSIRMKIDGDFVNIHSYLEGKDVNGL